MKYIIIIYFTVKPVQSIVNEISMVHYNWRAGASLPSCTTGAMFLYIYFSTGAAHT